MSHQIASTSNIQLAGLGARHFGANGLQVSDIAGVLSDSGFSAELPKLRALLPQLENRGVQSATKGIVQDPAGVAVGQVPDANSAGGASGAIYRKFPDLQKIPDLQPGAAVMNSSTGPGRRVLHTFSPVLSGSPASAPDCATALSELARAYANALLAARAAADAPGAPADFDELHLVPISGRIFAGSFRDPALDHLHPSYTLAALLVALADVVVRGQRRPQKMTLNYFGRPVFAAAQAVVQGIRFT